LHPRLESGTPLAQQRSSEPLWRNAKADERCLAIPALRQLARANEVTHVENLMTQKEQITMEETEMNCRPAESDFDLVAAAKRGDHRAFEILVKRYEKKVFSAALSIARNREDAEDITQQCFMKAFVHLGAFAGESAFHTWLTRIAINEALMNLRRVRPYKTVSLHQAPGDGRFEMPIDIPDSGPGIEESYAQRERIQLLSFATNKLNPEMRQTIELTLEERSAAETAKIMSVSVPTVKARLFRARRKLRPLVKRMFAPAHRAESIRRMRAA
jgi:RNA polymerase sigma-70 factor (ECF subfamily)